MPYISFKTNHKLTLRQENMIKEKSGELISLIPGKSEKALMIHMEDDQIMYETTKIDPNNIYVIFHEFDHWGLNQTLI